MKKWKKQSGAFWTAVMLLSTLSLGGCSGGTALQSKVPSAAALTHKVTANSEVPLLTKGPFSLYLEENMAVRVSDSRTGTVWTTNGNEADGTATTGQFTLSYYTANAAYSEMHSQTDSVEKGQAEAYFEGDVLYVVYRLGNYNKTYADVPNSITNERFEEKFLQHLSEAEQKDLKTYYKYYETEGYWGLRSKGRNNFEDILVFMEKVGYTQDDLAYDHAMFNITTESGPRAQFSVTLTYTLSEEGLSVAIPTERIAFEAEYPLYEIDLLPEFGRMDQSEDGYVLLPDGSGALMRFCTDYSGRSEFSVPIYGLDRSVASDTLTSGQYSYEQAALPVFGMVDGGEGYLAVIDGAPSKAILKAHQAGSHFPRNGAYVTFRMVNKDSVYLSGSDNSSKVVVFENGLAEETCSVQYRFLDSGSGYTEMAAEYRELLVQQGALTPLKSEQEVSLLVETIGGVKAKKNLLGVSYEGLTAATSYTDNCSIAEDLLGNGVAALDMKLIGWFNGGVYHSHAGNIKLNRVLGGSKGWTALLDFAEKHGVGLYPDVDFQKTAVASSGFFPASDAARRLDASEVRYSILSRALLLEKEDIGLTPSSLYVLSPSRLVSETTAFIKKFSAFQTNGLSLRSSGSELYSDFRSGATVPRPEAQKQICEHLSMLSAECDLMAETGFAYIYPYVKKLSGVSVDSSHYKLADETVPFLQMVLHGSVQMYSAPVNLASNKDTFLLRAIEYGVMLNYQVTWADSDVLKNSEYTDNYASGYSRWREDILTSYTQNREALSGLVGCVIKEHEQLSDEVFRTVYSNGDAVYVNYGREDAQINGICVPARGYWRERGEAA